MNTLRPIFTKFAGKNETNDGARGAFVLIPVSVTTAWDPDFVKRRKDKDKIFNKAQTLKKKIAELKKTVSPDPLEIQKLSLSLKQLKSRGGPVVTKVPVKFSVKGNTEIVEITSPFSKSESRMYLNTDVSISPKDLKGKQITFYEADSNGVFLIDISQLAQAANDDVYDQNLSTPETLESSQYDPNAQWSIENNPGDKITQTKRRTEQSNARKNVVQKLNICACCGNTFQDLNTITAHIYPRSKATDKIKKDTSNYAPMCAQCDNLWEKGQISAPEGILQAGPKPLIGSLKPVVRKIIGKQFNNGVHGPNTKKYLEAHHKSHCEKTLDKAS